MTGMPRIYLDNAATTPVDPDVLDRMVQIWREVPGNASSIHEEGRKARTVIEQARKTVARVLNASIGEIFFTSGGTESNNMVLKRATYDLGIRRFITTRTEHHAVLHTLEALRRDLGVELLFVEQSADGKLVPDHLESLLCNQPPSLVSIMHANNEIGTLYPLEVLSAICRRHGALFHCDTVQTIGYYPLDLQALAIDFISGSAHKFHGPKGSGFVYINQAHSLKPFLDGGSQERTMRGGTENVAGIAGLAAALDAAHSGRQVREARIRGLRNYLAQRLKESLPEVYFNGDPFGEGHYKILSTSFPADSRSDLLLLNLDIEGIAVSGGSACSSGADAGSHVMDALFPNSPLKTIRFSFSHLNTEEEIDRVMEVLGKIYGFRG